MQAKPSAPFAEITKGVKRNLMSAFKSTGIYPLSRKAVLKKLPVDENADPTNNVESCLTNYLKEQRFGGQSMAPRRRTRLNVEPGASVSTASPQNDAVESEDNVSVAFHRELENSQPISVDDPTNEEESSESRNDASEAYADLEIGRFVLAKFWSRRGKKTYRYVCRIIDLDPLVVVGFKSLGNKKEFRLVRDDISEIEASDILAYLPKPRPLANQDIDVECVKFF